MNKGWRKEAILQENSRYKGWEVWHGARLSYSLCPTEEEQLWLLILLFKCSELPEASVLGMEGTMIISMICQIKPESRGSGNLKHPRNWSQWVNSKINALPRFLTLSSQKRERPYTLV